MAVTTRFIEGSNAVGSWVNFEEKKKNADVHVYVDDKQAVLGYNKDINHLNHGTDFALVFKEDGVFFQHVEEGEAHTHQLDEGLVKKKLITFLKSFVKVVDK